MITELFVGMMLQVVLQSTFSEFLKPVKAEILSAIFADTFRIHTLSPMEIFAAKINALISRVAARDLYDFNNMVQYGLFDVYRKYYSLHRLIYYIDFT